MERAEGTAAAGERDENFLIAERRAKLARLRARGPAFPNDFRRDARAGELRREYGDPERFGVEALAALNRRARLAG
ncbi:MAG: lysine--tRNA ligase, partial [Planctomycetota bacterium]|nr:lysine--tRNA ligase [Planctomycetota bacterium]